MFALLRLFFMNGLMHPLFVAMGLSVLVAHSYAGQDHDHEHESPHQDEYKIDEMNMVITTMTNTTKMNTVMKKTATVTASPLMH